MIVIRYYELDRHFPAFRVIRNDEGIDVEETEGVLFSKESALIYAKALAARYIDKIRDCTM